MSWLKKFIKSVENNPRFNGGFCDCGSCQAHWEAAIILNSSKKLKIKIPEEKIEIENFRRYGDFAIKPVFNDINLSDKDLFLNDLIEELSEYTVPKPTRYGNGFTENIRVIIDSLIKVLIFYEKKKTSKLPCYIALCQKYIICSKNELVFF